MMTLRGLFYVVLIVLGFGLFFSVSSCSDHPKEIIPKEQMVDILYDYHLAQALGSSYVGKDNYERALYKESVFLKHGITEAQFDTSMVWYTRHTTVLAEMYKEIAERMKVEKKQIEYLISQRDKKPMISERGDSVDVWAWTRMLRLSQSRHNNLYTFVLPSDSNFRSTDRLVWEVDYHFLGMEDMAFDSVLVMQMLVHYECDSVISRIAYVSESGRQTLTLQNDTLGNIREVAGMLYLLPDSISDAVVLVDSICLYRYRVKKEKAKVDSLNSGSVKKEEKGTVVPLEHSVKLGAEKKDESVNTNRAEDSVGDSVINLRERRLQIQKKRSQSGN